MCFSHPYDQHERSDDPVRPMSHENLFREPEPMVPAQAGPGRRDVDVRPMAVTRHAGV